MRKAFKFDQVPISQSLIKAVDDYKKGKFCGKVLKAVFIDRAIRLSSSDAQRLGQYFEYKATGQLPFYGDLPKPDRLKPSAKKKKQAERLLKGLADDDPRRQQIIEALERTGKLSAPYQRAEDSAAKVVPMLEALGYEILATGKTIQKVMEIDSGNAVYEVLCEVNLDIEAIHKASGIPVIIDLKYSGLLETKWGEFAWGDADNRAEVLNEKPKINIQAKHYSFVTGKPFIWFVWPTTDKVKSPAFIEAIPTTEADIKHAEKVRATATYILNRNKNGWKAHPGLERCRDCPLADECQEKVLLPTIEVIELQ
jgi:hypothetical protein